MIYLYLRFQSPIFPTSEISSGQILMEIFLFINQPLS